MKFFFGVEIWIKNYIIKKINNETLGTYKKKYKEQ
jgi:hypothetical protein